MSVIRLFCVSFLLSLLSVSAMADTINALRLQEQLDHYNETNPTQNPQFMTAREAYKNPVIDSGNRVVGKINDMLVNQNGTIKSIMVEFDRIKRTLPALSVSVSEMGIDADGTAYQIGMNHTEIEEMIPDMMANIATASGEDAPSLLSVRRIVGAKLMSQDGRHLADVKSALFNDTGGRVEALYLEMKVNRVRGKKVAVPISMIDIAQGGLYHDLSVPNALADDLIAYAREL